jgi:hypothetical protein
MIKMNDWNRVLILEDDAELDMDPTIINTIINKSLEELDKKEPEWNVIMLATANKVLDKNSIQLEIPVEDGKTNKITIEKLHTATTSSAYIVKKTYVDSILNLFNNCNNNMAHNKMTSDGFEQWALDQKWRELQMKDKWFCFDKDPIKQREIWSTIQSNASKL